MAVSSLSLTLLSTTLSTNKLKEACSSIEVSRPVSLIGNYGTTVYDADQATHQESCKRRLLLLGGGGALITNLLPTKLLLAEEVPKDYEAFVDLEDGYSYYYPTNWREFDYRGHDSAFKDRVLSIQNVRVRFIPTDKKDIHDLGPMEQVINDVVRHVYAAPNQKPTIFNMQERTEDGRNYYTFEYELTSPNYSSVSFATIAIGNGRYYTLIVGANERRWKRVRNKLKVVADSFKLLEI